MERLKPTRVRLWQAGDMPGEGNKIAPLKQMRKLISALRGLQAWTYTHKPVLPGSGVSNYVARTNAQKIKECNDKGLAVNLSANNLSHADRLADLGVGPVASVLPADAKKGLKTPAGRKVVICPAILSDHVSCENCGGKTALCARIDRDYVIGFPAHGFRKNKASEVAKSEA